MPNANWISRNAKIHNAINIADAKLELTAMICICFDKSFDARFNHKICILYFCIY